jgi:hypothetical protein
MMSHLENAKKIVEFAKQNGFPNAGMFFWCEEGECSYDTPELAVDNLDNGCSSDFEISIHLSSIRLKNNVIDGYSNAEEVFPAKTKCHNCALLKNGDCIYSRYPYGCLNFVANPAPEAST